MKAILQQLYDGDIFPAERVTPKTEQYKAVLKNQYTNCNEFKTKLEALDPELYKQFMQIADDQHEIISLEFSDMFIEGFRLGARVVSEIYESDSPK